MNVISPEKQDKHLLDKLLAEREGIVYRMVRALKSVIDNGYRYTEPESVKEGRKRYQEANSTVITFFQDCMMPIPSGEKHKFCTVMKVYAAYQGWCKDNNRGYAKTAREFKDELAEYLGVESQNLTMRRRDGMVYKHHTLSPETVASYSRNYTTYCSDTPEDDFLN